MGSIHDTVCPCRDTLRAEDGRQIVRYRCASAAGKLVGSLVFVNFAKMILVAAFESPEFSLPETMEYCAFDIPLNDELVILLEVFSHVLLL